MSYDHVKDRTSSTVGTEDDGGVLFDETIVAYTQRRERAANFLIEALVESHHKALRAYLQRPQWTTINEDISTGELGNHLLCVSSANRNISRPLPTWHHRRTCRAAQGRPHITMRSMSTQLTSPDPQT